MWILLLIASFLGIQWTLYIDANWISFCLRFNLFTRRRILPSLTIHQIPYLTLMIVWKYSQIDKVLLFFGISFLSYNFLDFTSTMVNVFLASLTCFMDDYESIYCLTVNNRVCCWPRIPAWLQRYKRGTLPAFDLPFIQLHYKDTETKTSTMMGLFSVLQSYLLCVQVL